MITAILVPLDGSLLSEQALPTAAMLAAATEARITLLRVLVSPGILGYTVEPSCQDLVRAERREVRSYLSRLSQDLSSQGVRVNSLLVDLLPPVDAIVAQARQLHSDLIVMSSHGRTGWRRLCLGSVAHQVMRHAPCPVLLTPCGAALSPAVGAAQNCAVA